MSKSRRAHLQDDLDDDWLVEKLDNSDLEISDEHDQHDPLAPNEFLELEVEYEDEDQENQTEKCYLKVESILLTPPMRAAAKTSISTPAAASTSTSAKDQDGTSAKPIHLFRKRKEGFSLLELPKPEKTNKEITSILTPAQYFKRYFPPSHFEDGSFYTKEYVLSETGKSLTITATDIVKLYGAHMLMQIFKYPRMRMFWSENFAINLIQKAFSRDNFILIRNYLHFVDAQFPSRSNRLWKIQPIIDCVRNRCIQLKREIGNYAVDVQMIPLAGKCSISQLTKDKPSPVGLKNVVLTNSGGLILDFIMYSGLGIGPSVVLKLTETIPKGSHLNIDRYLTTLPLIEKLLELDFRATGTIMSKRVKNIDFTPDHKDVIEFVKNDEISVIQWHNCKCVTVVSSECDKNPKQIVEKCCKKTKQEINVPFPVFLKTRMWTVKAHWHLVGMAIYNSWLEYQSDCKKNKLPNKSILDFANFKMELAQSLLLSPTLILKDCFQGYDVLDNIKIKENLEASYEPPTKHAKVKPQPDIRFDCLEHWPESMDIAAPRRCRYENCSSRTRTKCCKCDVFLCIAKNKTCFTNYHVKKTNEFKLT